VLRGAGLACRRVPVPPLFCIIISTGPFFRVGVCSIRACWSHALFFALSSAGPEKRIQVMAGLSSQPLLEVVQSLFVPDDAGGHPARFRFF
jgi:hypothetical protein